MKLSALTSQSDRGALDVIYYHSIQRHKVGLPAYKEREFNCQGLSMLSFSHKLLKISIIY
jgi:hypothetical protein